MDEFYLVRKSDGAKLATLYYKEGGIGVNPRQVEMRRNPNLAETVQDHLEQEKRGGVSFGKYYGAV